MKFEFRGVNYWIEFQYDTTTKKKKVKNFTTCRIVTGDVENQQLVTEAKIARFHKDKLDKESARQYALNAAIQANTHFQPNGTIDDMRDFRRAARTAYHRRQGGLDYARAVRKGLIAVVLKASKLAVS
jgi:hypothetical protein